jgi:hypothetical protein
MTARHAYARIAYEDEVMQGLGFIEGRVYAANAVDSPNEDPFLVIKSGGFEKAFGTTGSETVTYWVHLPRSKSRNYWIIDEAIDRLKVLLTEVEHLSGEDGWVLSSASWIDTSRDLTDEAFNTITKYVTFRAATRNMVTP